MVDQLTHSTITVDPGQAIALPHRRPLTVCAIKQPLWLTQQGLARDLLLSDGECATLQRRGLVVVQALSGRALLRVQYPAHRIALFFCRAGRWLGRAFGATGQAGEAPSTRA